MQKVEGVEAVEVSLNEGRVRVRLKPGNRVDLERLRQVVADQGFTPREARVTVRGTLETVDGQRVFRVVGPETVYAVRGSDLGKSLRGVLTVQGVVGVPQKGRRPVLDIATVRKEEEP